jgi:hypothetical protein
MIRVLLHDHSHILQHLNYQPVLDVDAPGASSVEIFHQGFVGRWLLIGVSS